ncbi:MAG: FliI/YscN family ATPase [Deltaproteobacteria bacterium]|nr:FliI/YscN family ATPase [Deltaproteobacteria bacterium]
MTLVDMRRMRTAVESADTVCVQGHVVRAAGLILEARMPTASVGDVCEVEARGGRSILAQVVGVTAGSAMLMPFTGLEGVRNGSPVRMHSDGDTVPVGDSLLGRVVDAELQPLDDGPRPARTSRRTLHGSVPGALARRRISRTELLGIRVLDAFLTCGEGQRVGIMAGPGVGKSVLLGMMARHAEADVNVVALVGERGREVKEFIERDLQAAGLARSVVVVATSDSAPLLRVRAALAATAVAEHFRARGKRVLLIMDSLSRVAMAQREIGLAAGEPPTAKGYPPSVFALMPRLLERAGNDAGAGSITGFYTVLAEGDDLSDPVADSARSLLDGHIVLSRSLANRGHFPAVDILQSVSRVMPDVVSGEHLDLARRVRDILATYKDSADLVEVGAYQRGSNPRLDFALSVLDELNAFCRQASAEKTPLEEALARVRTLLAPRPAPRPGGSRA